MTAVIFRFLVERPKLCFSLTLGAHFLLLLVTASLYLWGYDILPADFTQVPLNLEDDDTKLRVDAWKFARHDSRVNINPTSVGTQAERTIQYSDVLELIYEDKNGNVFTKENLQHIQDTETKLFNNSIYQNHLCQTLVNGLCKPSLSVIRFFDGSYSAFHRALYDPHFENITGILSLANSVNETRAIIDFHLDKHAVIDSTGEKIARSRYTRSLFYIGFPLKGFHSTDDRSDEQWDEIQFYASKAFAESLNLKFRKGIGDMKLYYFLKALFFNAISQQVIYDLLLAGASFTFIFLFMLFQTQSLWITGWAVFSILTCFFGANLIYRLILDCRYIGIFHVLSVFIILGIGADDVFVFIDTWKASEMNTFRDLASRMSCVYRRAVAAMFTTSFTTIVAFVTGVSSPLLGVSTFGIFSALLVFVNYCSVIIFFPTVVITYELYWKHHRWHCFGDLKVWQITSRRDSVRLAPGQANEQEKVNGKYVEPSKVVSKFLEERFFENFIAHKTLRWVILAVFVVFLSVSIAFATQLTPDEEPVDVWGPGTNWDTIKGLRRSAFRPSQEDNVVEVNIIWGLKNQDRSSCHFTDFKCKGKTVLDTSFDLNPTSCQEALLEFCHELQTLTTKQLEKLKIRRNALSGEPEIQCFMQRLDDYFKNEVHKLKYSNETVFQIPSSEKNVRVLMERNPMLFNISLVGPTYDRYFEVILGYWLTNANQSFASHDYNTYGGLLGGSRDPTDPSPEPNYQGGKYGNKLLFASIAVNTTMVLSKTGPTEGLEVYEHWEDFVKQKMKKMPPTCNNAFQATPGGHNAWHWFKVKKVLASTAVRGILLGLGLAILLLVVMTSNWIVGLLCGAIISCITVGVVGVIPLAGWKLGVLESLNLTLVVGLAVDYVVHLADGYVRSQKHSRRDKVRETLGHVGISVLSGASTTLGASVFMLAAKILFFFQFGIFMFCTIGLSIAYALILFTTVLGIFGPEGQTGSLQPIIDWFKSKMRGPVQEDVPCNEISGSRCHSPTMFPRQTATPL